MINNDMDYVTHSSSLIILILNLALINPEFRLLWYWEISEKYSSLSDHNIILLEWKDVPAKKLDSQVPMTRRNIQKLLKNKHLL